MSVRCPPVCLSVNVSHFHLLLLSLLANFNLTWNNGSLDKKKKRFICLNASFVEWDSSVIKWRTMPFIEKRDKSHSMEICWPFLSIYFSRNTGPISTKLDTKLPWVKGMWICSNKGLQLVLRDNNCNHFDDF